MTFHSLYRPEQRGNSYKPGPWGPEAADRLVGDYGGWHGPWISS